MSDKDRIDVHVYLHLPGTQEFQTEVLSKLDLILTKEDKMSQELDDLTAQVTANETVEGSALTLIQGFAAQLAAAGTDPTKLTALKTGLKQSADALAAAVAANTPAAPPATP